MGIGEAIVGILSLISLAAAYARKIYRERREEARREKHDQIRTDVDSALDDRGWLQKPDSTRRSDGAPRDYDVSGPSGTLNRED